MNVKFTRRTLIAVTGSTVIAAAIAVPVILGQHASNIQGAPSDHERSVSRSSSTTPTADKSASHSPTPLRSGSAVATSAGALSWKSVLPQLPTAPASAPDHAYAATPKSTNTPVAVQPGGSAVGTLGPTALTGGTTTIPIVARDGEWAKVLLPVRRGLPSQGTAAAQSAGWIRLRDLQVSSQPLPLITVHLATRTIDISGHTWPIVIGAGATVTPDTITYIEDRWTDPREGNINLLGAFSTAADSPYDGNTGNVALHALLGATPGSAASHGCVRLPSDALNAASALPLGTLVVVTQ